MTHMCVKQYSGVNSVPQIHVHPEPQNVIFGEQGLCRCREGKDPDKMILD